MAVSEYFQATRRAASYQREMYDVDGEMTLCDFVMQAPLGLPAICDCLNRWQRELASWDRVHRLHYEALRAEPDLEMARLCAFLGADFSGEEISEAAAFASFEALNAKERDDFFHNRRLKARNSEDPDSFKVRRGKVGGYRDYFDAQQIAKIAKIDGFVRERLDSTLGYGQESPVATARA